MIFCPHIWSSLQIPSLQLESKLAASVQAAYNSPSRVRDSEPASDATSQTGEATAGFVQRPAIPPRSRRVTSRSPPEIAAEYRAIVMDCVRLDQSHALECLLKLRSMKKALMQNLALWQVSCNVPLGRASGGHSMSTDKTPKHIRIDERNHVEKPLLDQLAGLGWEIIDLDSKQTAQLTATARTSPRW